MFDLVHRAAWGHTALLFMARAFVDKYVGFLASYGPNHSLLSGTAHAQTHSQDNNYSVLNVL